jgi:hypothetical protein
MKNTYTWKNLKDNQTAQIECAYELEGRIIDLENERATIERALLLRPWENVPRDRLKLEARHIHALQVRLEKIEYMLPRLQQRLNRVENMIWLRK